MPCWAFCSFDLSPALLGGVELAEEVAQLALVGLAQEGVDLGDQRGHGGLLVHRLVGQRAELGAQRGDHPARQVDVAALGRATEMLLDRDHLLLGDEAVPAAEGLRVLRGIGVVGGHVLAHHAGRVLGDVEAGQEAVLQAHAGDRLGLDAIPRAVGVDERLRLRDEILIRQGLAPQGGGSCTRFRTHLVERKSAAPSPSGGACDEPLKSPSPARTQGSARRIRVIVCKLYTTAL